MIIDPNAQVNPMLRPAPNPQPQTVSDRELGVAALLLLVAVVLTALVVPIIA